MADTCRSCEAPVEWVTSAKSGKPVILDLDERDDGNIVVVENLLGERQAEYVAKGQGNRVSHFATCPNAQDWRRR